MSKYNHTVEYHNLKSPREIIPTIIELLNPKSVIDVGCGLGTFLKVFKENGVEKILGIDGSWCKKDLLFENIDPSEFLEHEMENRIKVNDIFDLVICLEVAEHISPERAETFVEDLTKMGNTILFSAAIPFQGGDHHLNEQWITYWEKIFNKNGFQVFDKLKPFFWNNDDIFLWYKQNMVIVTKDESVIKKLQVLPTNKLKNVVHPELFKIVSDYREKFAIKRYALGLYKSILYKLGFIK